MHRSLIRFLAVFIAASMITGIFSACTISRKGRLQYDPPGIHESPVKNAGGQSSDPVQQQSTVKEALAQAGNPADNPVFPLGNLLTPKKKVLVLTYHCINDKIVGVPYLYVSPPEFAKQMQYLKDHNYHVIPYSQMNQVDNIENPVVITFDDGYEDNYTYAYPVLKKMGYKATIFLVLDLLDRPLYIKKNQMKGMMDVFSLQSHTVSHTSLKKLTRDQMNYELSESKLGLELLTGKKVDAIAYPYGDFNNTVEKLAVKYYKYMFTEIPGFYTVGGSTYRIARVRIDRKDTLGVFARKVTLAK